MQAPPPVNAAQGRFGRDRGDALQAGGRARACYVGAMQAQTPRRNPRVSAALLRVAALVLPLAGCAAGDYPSLDQRPAEREGARETGTMAPATESAAPAAPVAPAPADLNARLAALLADTHAAHEAFLAARPAAAARVAAARDAAPASEPWAAATEAVSALAATRAPTVAALATLERLDADDTVDHALTDATTPRADAAAIRAAHQEVAGIAAGEQAELGDLAAALRD